MNQLSPLDPHPSESGEIARRAFDAVAAGTQARSLSELHEVTQTEFARLGFSIALGVHFRRHPMGADVDILFGDVDHPWCRHYNARNWRRRCPIVAAAGPRPTTWDDIKKRPLRPGQRLIFDELREFSMTEGLIVAIETRLGGICAVSLGGAEFDPRNPEARTAAHLLSVNYGLVGFDLMHETELSRRPVLTPRQVECLRWVRDGKTAWEIGAILGLSARTVEEHLSNACRALGVRSRVQAVITASRQGLFEL